MTMLLVFDMFFRHEGRGLRVQGFVGIQLIVAAVCLTADDAEGGAAAALLCALSALFVWARHLGRTAAATGYLYVLVVGLLLLAWPLWEHLDRALDSTSLVVGDARMSLATLGSAAVGAMVLALWRFMTAGLVAVCVSLGILGLLLCCSCVTRVAASWVWLYPYAIGASIVMLLGSPRLCRLRNGLVNAPAWCGVSFAGIVLGAAWMTSLYPQLRGAEWSAAQPGQILFFNKGGLDWKTPAFTSTGAWDGGMFGLLPAYLSGEGYDTAFADTAEELLEGLTDADVVVLINCGHSWTRFQRTRLREFLGAGGRLLVLGDHTDVFGLMGGLNPLLSEYGITFRFDSAYHARDSWDCCSRGAPGSFYARPGFPLGHGIGASLHLTGGARPLVSARHSFSDVGLRENIMGSYLGNYHLDDGETYGNLVLVATDSSSRLVVYGDTGAFQNGGLPHTWAEHVAPLFRTLVAKGPLLPDRLWPSLIASIVLMALAYRPAVAPALSLGIGLAIAWFYVSGPHPHGQSPSVGPRHAIVDVSHFARTGHYRARFNPIGPLLTNLQRSGVLPIVSRSTTMKPESPPGLWILLAPLQRHTRSEADAWASRMEAGGTVLAVGGGDSAVGDLARRFGFETREPLGECPVHRARASRQRHPRFRSAWSIHPPKDCVELFRFGEHVVAAEASVGAGRFIWIADSLFFSDANVEGLWGNHPGNMNWIRTLLKHIFGAPLASVAEPWHPPSESE